jgi:hypothetical protein
MLRLQHLKFDRHSHVGERAASSGKDDVCNLRGHTGGLSVNPKQCCSRRTTWSTCRRSRHSFYLFRGDQVHIANDGKIHMVYVALDGRVQFHASQDVFLDAKLGRVRGRRVICRSSEKHDDIYKLFKTRSPRLLAHRPSYKIQEWTKMRTGRKILIRLSQVCLNR